MHIPYSHGRTRTTSDRTRFSLAHGFFLHCLLTMEPIRSWERNPIRPFQSFSPFSGSVVVAACARRPPSPVVAAPHRSLVTVGLCFFVHPTRDCKSLLIVRARLHRARNRLPRLPAGPLSICLPITST
jgi:hypothetical protein